MISSFLSCVHQTHDRIDVYSVTIISYPYPISNPIMSLSYHAHQTGPKINDKISKNNQPNRKPQTKSTQMDNHKIIVFGSNILVPLFLI